MVNLSGKRLGDLLNLAIGFMLLILINILSSGFFIRLDLTEEQHYSIKPYTKELLAGLDDVVYAEVYLSGELNAPFQRFQKSIRETLEEFRIYSHGKFRYSFNDPLVALSRKARTEFLSGLAQKGITPTNIVESDDGQTSEKLIVPGAVLSFEGVETGVMLLKGSQDGGADQAINQSIENIEFEFARAIHRLTNTDRKRIGWIIGHGELDSLRAAGFNDALLEQFDVFKVDLSRRDVLANYDVVIVAKPRTVWSPMDIYKLDQYIVRGGRAMLLLDKTNASMDSVSSDDYYAFAQDLGFDDLLFHYGVRINPDLVQDRSAAYYPVVTGGNSQMDMLPWPFYPLVTHYADHPLTTNLDAVVIHFGSSMDSVKAEGIIKIPLLFTSEASRRVGVPVKIGMNDLRGSLGSQSFQGGPYALGYLLEGRFASAYKNRLLPEGADKETFAVEGAQGRIIVFADGDLARNEINPRTRNPLSLGFDPYANHTFANKDLLMNAVTWLAGERGLINARNKEVKIRPLDRERVRDHRLKWQIINIVSPLLLILAYGFLHQYWRRKKYAHN